MKELFSLTEIHPIERWLRRPPEDWRRDHLRSLLVGIVTKGWWPTELPEYETRRSTAYYPTEAYEIRADVMCQPLPPV